MTTDPKAEDPRVGSLVGERYRILERLSAGGMGEVYRGERVQLGRVVAVKFLHAGFAYSADFTRRFEQEARMMSRLDHPNCVSVIDFGVADAPYIVMDLVAGTTLKALIEQGPMPAARALAIARQILNGLAHAHEKGVIHRDVKPTNVMLAQATGTGDHVRLLDFGLGRMLDAEQSMSSNVVGTPSYMSPEQATGKKVDGRSDLYATSVVLYELLTGEKPFQHEEALQVIRKHIEEPPPALALRLPGARFSPELEALVRRGLAKPVDERFPTAEAFVRAIEQVPEAQSGRSVTAPAAARMSTASQVALGKAPTLLATPAVARERGRAGVWLGRLVFVALVAGGGFTWDHFGRPGLPAAANPVVAGDGREVEIRELHDERRKRPGDATIPYRLGTLYSEKGWHAEAIAAYLKAMELSPKYRSDKEIIRTLIDALGDERTRDNARAVLTKRMGAAALPQLKVAAKSSKQPEVRREAVSIADEIARGE